jgi:hypothetical protein
MQRKEEGGVEVREGVAWKQKNWKTRQKGNHGYRSKTEFEVVLKRHEKVLEIIYSFMVKSV